MDRRRFFQKSVTVVLAAMVVGTAPVAVPADDGPKGSLLTGKVFAADGKTPVAGATVHAYHLSTEETTQSDPTAANGEYNIPELEYGYYDLAVETPDGLYVASHVVNVPPGGKVIVLFTLLAYGPDDPLRQFPGTEDSASGLAKVLEKKTRKEFFRSPKGVALAAGTGGAVLLIIASGSDPASISTP